MWLRCVPRTCHRRLHSWRTVAVMARSLFLPISICQAKLLYWETYTQTSLSAYRTGFIANGERAPRRLSPVRALPHVKFHIAPQNPAESFFEMSKGSCGENNGKDRSNDGAGGGSRTHTALRPTDFESAASAIPPLRRADYLRLPCESRQPCCLIPYETVVWLADRQEPCCCFGFTARIL